MPKQPKSRRSKSRTHDRLVFCLQGGGSMGAYQVGVIEALQEDHYFPDWFVGTSIGAINSAIAAGNPLNERVQQMRQFWRAISTPAFPYEDLWPNDRFSRQIQHFISSQCAVLFGQPGFFSPLWNTGELLNYQIPPLGYYDTSPLKKTLESFVDFDRINSGETRLSVGAVEVSTGMMHYFDSEKHVIGPEHIMASGALPPGFPPVEIDGRLYWDGGLSSNTPLSYALKDEHPKSLLCFMVHLFDSYGLAPTNLDEVERRRKDIAYSSKFNKLIEMHSEIHALRYAIHQLIKEIPDKAKQNKFIEQYRNNGWDKTVTLVRFLYAGQSDDLSSKDYEFSRKSIEEHIQQGYRDGRNGTASSPWLETKSMDQGIVLYDMSDLTQKPT